MKYILATLIAFIFHQYSYSELVSKKTYASNEIEGQKYLKIKKGTEVRLIETKSEWCYIMISAVIKEIVFVGDSGVISKGSKLYNKRNGKIIGEIIQDLFIYEPFDIYEPTDGYYDYTFGGYIKLNHIEPTSIPERVIENKINKILPDTVFYSELKDVIKFLGFRENSIFHKDSIAEYWKNDLLDGYHLHPGIRIDLIFKDDVLIGIFHMRPLKINGSNQQKIDFTYLNNCCYLFVLDYVEPKIHHHLYEIYKEYVYSIH